jgi:hypothetical protein
MLIRKVENAKEIEGLVCYLIGETIQYEQTSCGKKIVVRVQIG